MIVALCKLSGKRNDTLVLHLLVLWQMQTVYARSNRLLRIFHGCNIKVLIELGRSLIMWLVLLYK